MSSSRAASPRRVAQSTEELVWWIQRAADSANAACAGVRALSGLHSQEQQQLTYRQVIVSLATLQSAVSDLSRAYINHANTVLNRGSFALDPSILSGGLTSGITSSLLENGLLSAAPRHTSPGAKSEVGEKKKRKRAPPDPNAPKRALTPYFLFMQHNRAQIAQELGPNAKPKEVADEGTRRWAEMPEAQKEVCSSCRSQACQNGTDSHFRCGRSFMQTTWLSTRRR